MVRRTVIGEIDMHAASCERYAIEFDRRYPSRNSVWVLDSDFVARRVIAKGNFKTPPRARDARVKMKPHAPQTETQNPLDTGPIHPTR